MKLMILGAVLCLSANLARAEGPAGFEDPALLESVMNGKIVFEDKLDTKVEFRTVGKAFFAKASPEAYAQLASNFEKYPQLFTEVKEGKTLTTSDDKLDRTYSLNLEVKVGFITQQVLAEGHQTLVPALDAISEYRILNEITNLKDQLKSATQVTRLIPHEGGFLVEDDVHVVLTKPSATSGMVKKKLKEFFGRYIATFRKELTGTY